MESSHIDKDRIDRMLREGILSAEEAARLNNALLERAGREQILTNQIRTGRRRGRRSLSWMLGLCGLFLAIGIASGLMLQVRSDDPGSAVANIDTTITAGQPEGRLINPAELDRERRITMGKSGIFSTSLFIIVIVALVGIGIMLIFNSLVGARESVNAGWAQVENQYQRRLDLVPVLIDGVKTYMDHERETLEALTTARANAQGSYQALAGQAPETDEQLRAIEASQGRLQSALARLFAVVENYPDLKASQNFLTLQDQIEGTENRIAVERRNYNEFSQRYNARILQFPFNVVANAMGFESKPYFQAESAAIDGLNDPFDRDS